MKNISRFFSMSPQSKKPFFLFLVFYLVLCFVTYGRFGVTWDEYETYINGGLWLKYYLGQSNVLFDPDRLADSMSHNYLNAAIVRALTFSKTILLDRIHLVNALFAIPIFWMFFELLRRRFNDWRWALMGPFVLFLTPRFTGDIPANPKDAPFAVLYFISLGAMLLAKEWVSRPWVRFVLLGTLFGLTSCLRIAGLTLFPIYIFFKVFEGFFIERELVIKTWWKWVLKEGAGFLLALVVSQAFLCLFWPYLGKDYFHHFWDTVNSAEKFSWGKEILFMGSFFRPLQEFRWYYLPVWVGIATPVFILFFGFFSLVRFKDVWKDKLYFLMVLALVFNLSLYLFLRPEIYNGLRHYLFLVPILSFLACFGVVDFFGMVRLKFLRILAVLFVCVNAITITRDLLRLFPYDYIYFNEMVGGLRGANGKFETDYWGASLREATLWLKDNQIKDPAHTYKVKMTCSPWQQQIYFSQNMKGDAFYTPKQADYWLAVNGLIDDYVPSNGRVIHVVEREGVPLAYVVKIQKAQDNDP